MTDPSKPLNDRQRAFLRYKQATKEHGRPFFPHETFTDTVVGVVVVGIILTLTVAWYSMAGCGQLWDISCSGDQVLTAHEQAVITGEIDDEAEISKVKAGFTERTGREFPEDARIVLEPLYEEKADPATTKYHPRPEWYFYFLFYLLVIFSSPSLVLMGTIGVPTLMLVLLLAWPFLDRSRERRPSRRPLAMTAMVVTAVVLLSFTWLGAQSGKVGGVEGLTDEQVAMPGYELVVNDSRGQCLACHMVGGAGNSGPGPDLSEEALLNRGIEWQIEHLKQPTSQIPGSGMPAYEGVFSEEEIEAVAKFLETLGMPERATDPEYAS